MKNVINFDIFLGGKCVIGLFGTLKLKACIGNNKKKNQRTEGPESCTDGETLIFWD